MSQVPARPGRCTENVSDLLPPVSTVLLVGATVVVGVSFVFVARAIRGPTLPDRVIAINAMGTSTIVVASLLAAGLDEPGFVDVALVYALLNFLLSIGLARFAVDRGWTA